MRESALLSSALSRNPALQQVSNPGLCEGDGFSGLDWKPPIDTMQC